MKFVCMKCESFMEFQKVESPAAQSMGVTFSCASCGARVAMVTNPGETAMVQALGVKIGGRTDSAEPLELTRQNLKGNGINTVSASDQQEMLKAEMAKMMAAGAGAPTAEGSKCPFASMVSKMQGGAESSTGGTTQTLIWTPEAKERIERVPSFMRPMIEMGIEGYARRNGITTITPEVMDASKNDPGEMVWPQEAEARLANIPSFVRPMAKKEIERIARERGMTTISNELLEETKAKFIGLGY